MDINEDVATLLDYVSVNIKVLESDYQVALNEADKLHVSKPLIKGCLENLRSVLDYIAQDVSGFIGGKSGIYFPYALDEPLFRKSVKKELHCLREKFPRGYDLIESMQPFRCGDDWLYRLCKLVNANKHNKLTGQLRVNSRAYRMVLGEIASLGENCSIVFQNCMYDDVRLGWDSPIEIAWDTPIEEVNRRLGVTKNHRSYEWVEFHFEGGADDALSLIKKCHFNISRFAQDLYPLM